MNLNIANNQIVIKMRELGHVIQKRAFISLSMVAFVFIIQNNAFSQSSVFMYKGNPLVTSIFTADPAALVHDSVLYVYTGHDEQIQGGDGYIMKDWYVFSTKDMVNWTNHGAVLSLSDFKWASAHAWAGQCVYRNGKFYWYVPVYYDQVASKKGFAIGVAVSDSPTGPFKDAIGAPLITNDMTTDIAIDWDNIDPTVFVDDDGQAYLYFGNTSCKYVKLKENMIETDGEIVQVNLNSFTEAPYIHKKDSLYYLSYAYGWPEKIAYATSKSITGPWTYRGIINELANNSTTNHQSIIEFKGAWYFIYHNGALPTGGNFRRSVCIDTLFYNPDNTIKKVVQTTKATDVSSINSRIENQVTIYPNPVNGNTLNIKINDELLGKDLELNLTSLQGISFLNKQIKNADEAEFSLEMNSGIYVLSVISDNVVASRNLIYVKNELY